MGTPKKRLTCQLASNFLLRTSNSTRTVQTLKTFSPLTNTKQKSHLQSSELLTTANEKISENIKNMI